MKPLLLLIAISIIGVSFILSNNTAFATPVSYNVTSLSIPFTSYTRANFDLLTEAGYNGTITSAYQGRSTNSTLNWEFGYHPTLPLSLDTKANITASASVAATQSIPLTISSSVNNKVIVVGISFQHNGDVNHNNARMSTVKIGTTSFILAINKTITCGANACSSEIWYLNNTSLSGAQTITITPSSVTLYHMVAGAYSFYNVRNLQPLGTSSSNTAASAKAQTTMTPTFTGSSLILDNLYALTTTSPNTNATYQQWVGKTAAIMGASQFQTNPTINSANTLSYTIPAVTWATSGIELIPIQNQANWGFNLAYTQIVNAQNMISNGSKIYYISGISNAVRVNHIDTSTGVETHDFTFSSPSSQCAVSGTPTAAIFMSQNRLIGYCMTGAFTQKTTISGGNVTNATAGSVTFISDEKIKLTGGEGFGDKFNSNSTTYNGATMTSNQCELTYIPSNTTTVLDNIGCDKSIPNHATRYWNGMLLYKIGNYYTNSTLPFFTSIDANTYKKYLTIPASIYNIPDPDVKLFGHWGNTDYLISVSASKINYVPMSTIVSNIGSSRAYQSYVLTVPSTDSHFYLAPTSSSPQISMKLYGPALNVTVSKYGMLTIPSGYTMKTSSSESLVRSLDPRWTNTPQLDIPAISTTGTMFPIVLTVANAPTDGALWMANSAQVINNENSAWCITQLDSTHTAECDIQTSQCPEVYVADSSVAPTVFIDQGSVCATGTNTKTIAYTNTLPVTFYQLKYSAIHSYSQSNPNTLTVTTRSSTAPYTYTLIVKNSTGSTTQNYTTTINGTIDTKILNVTNATKPASLFVYAGGGQIYSAYLGSPVSLASVASFFHTYLSYQGFDLISIVPILFASMFTRNTVGIGVVMVVLCVATLNFLSVSIIPDTYVVIMAIIASVGLVGYRGVYG